jgi:hypothetical protein
MYFAAGLRQTTSTAAETSRSWESLLAVNNDFDAALASTYTYTFFSSP